MLRTHTFIILFFCGIFSLHAKITSIESNFTSTTTTCTFTGAQGNNWDNVDNWSCDRIPGSRGDGEIIIIPVGETVTKPSSFHIKTSTTLSVFGELTILDGNSKINGDLTVHPSGTLTIEEDNLEVKSGASLNIAGALELEDENITVIGTFILASSGMVNIEDGKIEFRGNAIPERQIAGTIDLHGGNFVVQGSAELEIKGNANLLNIDLLHFYGNSSTVIDNGILRIEAEEFIADGSAHLTIDAPCVGQGPILITESIQNTAAAIIDGDGCIYFSGDATDIDDGNGNNPLYKLFGCSQVNPPVLNSHCGGSSLEEAVANADTVCLNQIATSIGLLENDVVFPSSTVTITQQPQHGSLVKTATGVYTYTLNVNNPVVNRDGGDSFQYKITHNGTTSTAVVHMNLNHFALKRKNFENVCENNLMLTVENTDLQGHWQYNSANITVLNSNSLISPVTLIQENATLTWIDDAYQCPDINVQLARGTLVLNSPSNLPDICPEQTTVNLNTRYNQDGTGTWYKVESPTSRVELIGGQITLGTLSPPYSISIIYEKTEGTCLATIEDDLNITSSTVADLSLLPTRLCSNAENINLNELYNNPNDTWNVEGQETSAINLENVPSDNIYTVTRTIQNGACNSTGSIDIPRVIAPEASNYAPFSTLCEHVPLNLNDRINDPSLTATWYIEGNEIQANIQDENLSVGEHQLTYRLSKNGCTTEGTHQIEIENTEDLTVTNIRRSSTTLKDTMPFNNQENIVVRMDSSYVTSTFLGQDRLILEVAEWGATTIRAYEVNGLSCLAKNNHTIYFEDEVVDLGDGGSDVDISDDEDKCFVVKATTPPGMTGTWKVITETEDDVVTIDDITSELTEICIEGDEDIQIVSELTPTKGDTIKVKVTPKVAPLIIAEGFSPNGDLINDYFEIMNVPKDAKVQLTIINRWEQVVYESDNYQNTWGGTFKDSGGPVPNDSYVYRVKVNQDPEISGTVIIKR